MLTFAKTTRKLQENRESWKNRQTRSRVLRHQKADDESSNLDAHLQLSKANKPGKITSSCPSNTKSLIM